MKNKNLIKKFQQSQAGLTMRESIELETMTISICDYTDNYFWNFASIDDDSDLFQLKKDIQKAKDIFKDNSKNGGFVLEDLKEKENARKILLSCGYREQSEVKESWFTYQSNQEVQKNQENQKEAIFQDERVRIKKVETEQEFDFYRDLLVHCFGKNDPKNSIGEELGEAYLRAIKESWIKSQSTPDLKGKMESFLILEKQSGKAVGCFSVNFDRAGGYIFDIGVLPEFRGLGFGKVAVFGAVQKSKEHGNKLHYFRTTTGTFAEEFYLRNGFKREFIAGYFVS